MAPRMMLYDMVAAPPSAVSYMTPNIYKRASVRGPRGPRTSPMMNHNGDFNGTCDREEAMTITPETPTGSCSS